MKVHGDVIVGHTRRNASEVVRHPIHLLAEVRPRHYLPRARRTLAAHRNQLVGGLSISNGLLSR